MSQSSKPADPTLDLFQYFSGQTRAWGIFEDRFGNLRRSFTVNIYGDVMDSDLTGCPELRLMEEFLYDDGERDQRIWMIEQQSQHRYSGTADDVVGEAVGQVRANQFSWRYTMRLKVGSHRIKVTFDDRMYLLPDQVLVNRAKVSKFGLHLGTVLLLFNKAI